MVGSYYIKYVRFDGILSAWYNLTDELFVFGLSISSVDVKCHSNYDFYVYVLFE